MNFFSLNKEKNENNWESHFALKPEDISFQLHFFDLYSGDEKKLLANLREVLQKLNRPDLSGPVYLIVRELLTNSLKAVYKKIYLEYFIAEMGMSDLGYEDWLSIFKTEIDTHMAENFANLCREKNIFVKFNMTPLAKGLLIEIINDGVPSEIEWERLQKSLTESKKNTNMAYLFTDEDDENDLKKEGAGIGVPLISMMLRNLDLDLDNFKVIMEDNKTISKLFFPFTLFPRKN